MLNKLLVKITTLLFVLLLVGCTNNLMADNEIVDSNEEFTGDSTEGYRENMELEIIELEDIEKMDITSLREHMIEKFQEINPTEWGETVSGVVTRININEKVIALTFDACDRGSDVYDEELINFLIEENIPATLFISGRWIDDNEDTLRKLIEYPNFEIANHGYEHRPLSVNGNKAYNIRGTSSVEEAFDEVFKNQQKIFEVTGKTPIYFRSGTAYYDEVAVQMVEELGLKVINYNVLGDAGATFTKKQIVNSMMRAEEGAIILFHMNKPKSPIAEGVKEGVIKLKERGFRFVLLSEYDDYLH